MKARDTSPATLRGQRVDCDDEVQEDMAKSGRTLERILTRIHGC